MGKYKRLTLADRIVIQAEISKNKKASDIARRLKVSPSTITREIAKNGRIVNVNKKICSKRSQYLSCNQCPKRGICTGRKTYYDFNLAESKSSEKKRSKKKPFHITPDQLEIIDNILIKGVRGQNLSIHHLYVSYDELKEICSERTITRYVVRGLMTIKAHELHKYVRFEHKEKYEYKEYPTKSAAVIANRTYYDYLKTVKENPEMNIMQYDSVEGAADSKKYLLTITFKEFDFQFGYIYFRTEGTAFVVEKMWELYEKLGIEISRKVFQINISDNGFEFSSFYEAEKDKASNEIGKVFYTRPYTSTDKSECERNHEIVRYCLPKGRNFDNLTQDDIDEMFSNINSYVRKAKNDKTPYELVKEKYGIKFLNAINIREINKKEVKLLALV